jgi:hypothetical protein
VTVLFQTGGLGIETGRQRLGTGGLRGLCKECEGCHSKSPRGGLCEYSAEENPPVGSVKKIVAVSGEIAANRIF